MADPEPDASTPLLNNGNGNGNGGGNSKTCESSILNWFKTLPQRGHKFWLTSAAVIVALALFLYLLSLTFPVRRSRGRWRSLEPAPNGTVNAGHLLKLDALIPASLMDLNSTMSPPKNKFVLIDTDAGLDDAWALLLLLKAHQDPKIPITIVGITTVAGNTHVGNVMTNVQRVLELMGEENIPVYKGAEEALVHPLKEENYLFFGKDGFGDAKWDRPVLNHSYVKSQSAAAAIVELAEKYKDAEEKLTILAIGPLTNLATAFRLQPKLNGMLQEAYFLGGNWEAVGNIGMAAEFNAYADAEAAQIVLDSIYPVPFHVVPWELCRYNRLEYAFRTDTLGLLKTKEMEFLNKIEADSLSKLKDGWLSGDSFAAAVVLDNAVATKSEAFWATIELDGEYTRGMMVVEKREWNAHTPNVNFTTIPNMELYKKILIWTAGGPSYN